MRPMREYFLAGLALDEANDKRDRARKNLRDEALKYCPDAIKALDEASDAVKAAEGRLAHTMMALMKGEAGQMRAEMNQWAEDHARTCDEPDCEIKKFVREQSAARDANKGAAN